MKQQHPCKTASEGLAARCAQPDVQERKAKAQWLGRYQAAVREQALLAEELVRLRAEAEKVTVVLHGMPGRGAPDAERLPRAVERIVAAQEALESQIAACLQCRAEVAAAVAALEHPQQQEVLRRRYLLGQSYAEIGDAMGLVERRVFQLHRQALDRLRLPAEKKEEGFRETTYRIQ